MKQKLLIALCVVTLVSTLTLSTACSNRSEDPMLGTWQFYGVMESGNLSDYEAVKEKDIITGEDFQTTFGAEVPDNTITLTDKGVKEYLDLDGKGSQVTGWERLNDHQYRMTVTITQLVGEQPLKEPIEQQIYYTLAKGYLFQEYSPVDAESLDSEYENYNINVYTRN